MSIRALKETDPGIESSEDKKKMAIVLEPYDNSKHSSTKNTAMVTCQTVRANDHNSKHCPQLNLLANLPITVSAATTSREVISDQVFIFTC